MCRQPTSLTRKLSQTQVEEQKIDADKQEIVLALKLRKQEELQKLALEAEEEAKNSWMNPDKLNPKNLAPKDEMMMGMDMAMEPPAADAM